MNKGYLVLVFLLIVGAIGVYATTIITDTGITIGSHIITVAENGTILVNGQASIGPTGATGPQGYNGTQGLQGIQGERGFNGTQGIQGLTGANGTQGIQGERGYNGTQGNQGIQGFNGTQGIQGEQGIQGDTGANGTQGIQGNPGVNGYTWYSGSGAPGAGLGVNSDHYLDTANSDVYLKSGGSWSVETNIKGLTGNTGPAGTTGVASKTSQVSITNSNAETQLIGYTIPADTLVAGSTYRIDVYGTLSCVSANPATTATFRVRIGTTTLTGNIATSLAPTLANSVAMSTKPFHITAILTVRTDGNGGTCIAQAFITGEYATAVAQAVKGTATTATQAVDTTANKIIEMTFQYGTANGSNTLKVDNAVIELVKS